MSDFLATPESLAADAPIVEAWNEQLAAEIARKQGFYIDDRAFLAGLHRELKSMAKNECVDELLEVGNRIRDRAASIAEAHRLTGETIDSLEAVREGDSVIVGSNLDSDKPASEEFGTFDQAPRPFMRPAILEAER